MQRRRVADGGDAEEAHLALLAELLERRHDLVQHGFRRHASPPPSVGDRIVQVEDVDLLAAHACRLASSDSATAAPMRPKSADRIPHLGADDDVRVSASPARGRGSSPTRRCRTWPRCRSSSRRPPARAPPRVPGPRGVPRTMSPPTAPQPKPKIDTRSPVRPKIRISMCLILPRQRGYSPAARARTLAIPTSRSSVGVATPAMRASSSGASKIPSISIGRPSSRSCNMLGL